MPLEGCNDYGGGGGHHHHHHHHHHSDSSSQQSSGGGTLGRARRSSYGHTHYQQQLSITPTINYNDGQNSCPSPSRFSDSAYSTLGNRLTYIPPPEPERYGTDDKISPCCMIPPSPAPTNDRYPITNCVINDKIGMQSTSPSVSHLYQEPRFSVHHRSMSPPSRYSRNKNTDRYRDTVPKNDQYGNQYMVNSSSADTYSYLTSTVHTPVKRYIPTPPPQETYQHDNNLSSTLMAGLIINKTTMSLKMATDLSHGIDYNTGQLCPSIPRNQMMNTIPYRLKVNCCSEKMPSNDGISEHYATPPRIQPLKVGPLNASAQTLNTGTLGRHSQRQPDYSMIRTPTPVSIMSEPMPMNTSMGQIEEDPCLHCNTLRRATGVHQTTQTSGPISPQPLSISSMSDMERQSPMSPPSIASLPISHASLSQQMHHQTTPKDENRTLSPMPIMQNSIQYPQPVQQIQPIQPMLAQPQTQQLAIPRNQQQDSPLSTLQRNTPQIRQRLSKKQRIKEFLRHETAQFFGVDYLNEEYERQKWEDRQKRLAIRRFGPLKDEHVFQNNAIHVAALNDHVAQRDRPDILPAQSQDEPETEQNRRQRTNPHYTHVTNDGLQVKTERKSSVPKMIWNGIAFVVQTVRNKRARKQKQWSRSFAPAHVALNNDDNDLCDGLTPIHDDETFFDTPVQPQQQQIDNPNEMDNSRQIYLEDPSHNGMSNGWRTRSAEIQIQQQRSGEIRNALFPFDGQRISAHILDGVIDNSRRPIQHNIKLLRPNTLDDRYDYRPFFTYWVNLTQILILVLSLICYGFAPIGLGVEQKSSQVLVTSLSLQQVQHYEARNVWIGPKTNDLVHLGAKFAACMRQDVRVLDIISKTKRDERDTACCIRNDDSGCVQSSKADCSVRGLWPTSISTWKKWSPGDLGPGGRVSGTVCGLDPKYCDAPASKAPHEWPDDITKWPICRKNNQFSQRFRFKDQTAEHMVCEVLGHPCCVGVYGECRITTREYCDFVHGYFHEEASLCSQVSCLGDVCGLFPFIATDIPDQFYRIFTSLYLHAGIIHLIITVAFQHILLADLERLMGSIRTSIVYIGSGIAGNLTSAIFVPYKAEVGPLPALAGTLSSLLILLILCHWRNLKKPHLAMIKLLVIGCTLFGMGTLPWQHNFTGLISGLIFGTTFTLALTPYINLAKYNRKSKINLIWTCFVLHLSIYAIMFIVFYIFPTIFSLNFLDNNNQVGTVNHGVGGWNDNYNPYDGVNYFNGKNGDVGISNNHNNGHQTTRDYDRGGSNRYGNGGGAISMSGGTIKTTSYKSIAICEKGQCNPQKTQTHSQLGKT